VEEADLEHIAEEIEYMGASRRRELQSRLTILIAHLLKWQFQPPGTRSWKSTILTQRLELESLLAEAPSLRAKLAQVAEEIYPAALELASVETDLPARVFPEACPYDASRLLDQSFLPSPTPQSGS
jgi:hypothetical protein